MSDIQKDSTANTLQEPLEIEQGDEEALRFEEALNVGGDHNRDPNRGPKLQDNQLPGDRTYGNANERGVPGAFGRSPDEEILRDRREAEELKRLAEEREPER